MTNTSSPHKAQAGLRWLVTRLAVVNGIGLALIALILLLWLALR